MSPLERYLRHLSVERGLSRNTLSAYRSDLSKYLLFLQKIGTDALGVTSNQLSEYSVELADQTSKASSNARTLAAVRGFHRFLVLENLRTDDPTIKLRPPKLAKRLPKSLTQDQVLSLLRTAGPDPDDESTDLVRLRDRAILELMYSTGTRVSEVVQLDLDLSLIHI